MMKAAGMILLRAKCNFIRKFYMMKGIQSPWRRIDQIIFTLLAIFFLSPTFSSAQEEATAKKTKRTDYKNSIKYNVTSQIVYRNAFLLGYERVLKNNQSLNISGGLVEFPLSISFPDSLRAKNKGTKSGYNITLDWRFYLANENKYAPPHGIYLAPFFSVHHFSNDRDLTYIDTSGTSQNVALSSRINFITIGGELGYQFVIKRRFVVDAILFGPGITNYYFKAKLDGNISPIDKGPLATKIIDALKEKLPLLKDLTSGEEVNSSGVETFWSVGFRYSISIGYRF
jgi:hypothetical protein